MRTGSTLCVALLALLASSTLGCDVTYAQVAGLPQFFQMNIPEVDGPANAAMDRLTEGMSLTLAALNNGRRQKVTISAESGKQALQDFSQAREILIGVFQKIPQRKVNLDVVHKSQYAKAYDELVISLRESNYPEPTDSKVFFNILSSIIERCEVDLMKLMNSPAGPGGQQAIVEAFLDLIKQKTLLERIGATSGIITVAMS
jgi:hypothetical protein